MSNNKNVVPVLSIIALFIIAVLEIVTGLSRLNIDILGATVINLLNTVKNICIILVIGISAFHFVKGRKKGWLIAYIIALVIFVAGTVLIWL